MNDCIFCKIAAGLIPSQKVYESETVFAFRDINPQAPVHVLIVPKRHIAKISDVTKQDSALMTEIIFAANKIAREEKVASDGYRLVWNCEKNAGQTVFHIHLHLLGGRIFGWPPG